MNVIGIVQTDMNEFNILVEQEQNQQQGNQQNNQQQQNQGSSNSGQGDNQQQDGGSPSDFFNLLMGSGDQNSNNNQQQGQGQGQNQQQQQGPQEMTVRIKGVPEGQKATFLQMYQIIQDAHQTSDIERSCTIVSFGDQQGQGQQQGQKQKQGQGQNNGNSSRQQG